MSTDISLPPTLSFIVTAIVIHQLEDSIIFCGNHAGKDLFLCCVLFSMVMVKANLLSSWKKIWHYHSHFRKGFYSATVTNTKNGDLPDRLV